MNSESGNRAKLSTATTEFETQRSALTALAYRMLGEKSAAADVVQEAWLRWNNADPTSIQNPAAWLRQTTTRLAIDALRSAKRQRETYIGPWLAEPLIETDNKPDEHFELAKQCELALLWAMERLAPDERAAFILREAFDADYLDIAQALDKSEDNCRAIVSRARKRVRSDAPRFDAPTEETNALLLRFAAATQALDHATVMNLLAPNAVALTDGGGKARASLRTLEGPREIANVLINIAKKNQGAQGLELLSMNGRPAIGILQGGAQDMLYTLEPDDKGLVRWIYIMRNPDKLPAPTDQPEA